MTADQATSEGTASLAGRHASLAYNDLGATGLWVSQAGFGGYRISADVAHHGDALRTALCSGINLIDTSTNYANGGSEILIGRSLAGLIAAGKIARIEVVLVSKAGYLQGANYTLGQQRKSESRPFPELVEFGENMAHCIHPEFLEDQIGRSLERLSLKSLDVFLLHNPEYYLEWARKQQISLTEAREVYYGRIRKAFQHLETEADSGRIRYYGVSSNTFAVSAEDPEFTSLEKIWEIARSMSPSHRFRAIQLPFNLLESGAALEKNQADQQTVLEFAHKQRVGVLINRPLNAFTGSRLIRLAEVEQHRRQDTNEIIKKIRAVGKSEKQLWRRLLPALEIPPALLARIKQQIAIGDVLKHYWRNFGSYDHWRQVKSGNLQPRVQGVLDFMATYAQTDQAVDEWIKSHTACIESAYRAVGSIYAESEALRLNRIRRGLDGADEDWSRDGTLSQKAIRAVRSTLGVTTVLVGMRREAYVEDVVGELKRPVEQTQRGKSWQSLNAELAPVMDEK